MGGFYYGSRARRSEAAVARAARERVAVRVVERALCRVGDGDVAERRGPGGVDVDAVAAGAVHGDLLEDDAAHLTTGADEDALVRAVDELDVLDEHAARDVGRVG